MANEQTVVTICTYSTVKKGQSTASMHYCPHAGPFCKPENANVTVQVQGRAVFVCPQCKAQIEAGAQLKWEWPETPDSVPRAAKAQREADAKTMTPAAYREKHGCVAEPPKADTAKAGK